MPHDINMLPVSRKVLWGIIGSTLLAAYPLIHTTFHLHWLDKTPRPERTIIVTGATGKLGHPTVFHLASRQCRVIMACRDMDKCKSIRREIVLATKNKSLVCRHVDLEDIESINKFVDQVAKDEPHLDVIINNAAIKDTKGRELTKYGIEKHYFVNFLAPYLLTLRLMNKLEESAKITNDSRVVNVIGNPKKSWHIDLLDINFDKRNYTNEEAYNQSKLALAYFSILLEKFNREKRNQVYVFGTSPSASRILPSFTHETGFWAQLKIIFKEYYYLNAVRVCERTVKCALDPDLVRNGLSGKLYNWFLTSLGANGGWGVAALNEDKAKVVWNVAADMLLNAREVLVNPKEPPKQVPSVPNAEVPSDSDQVKVQGNNKASGVDESA
jgi:NAD(P)-dependent dehydrogenase (short-subunit alcohol dehydrogenase family)